MHLIPTPSATSLLLALTLLVAACGESNDDGRSPEGTGDSDGTPGVGASVEVDATTAGTIHGVVKFEGTAPKRSAFVLESEAHCVAKHAGPLLSETVIVNDDGTLRNVVVAIKRGLPSGSWPVPSEPVRLTQEGCRYVPHVLAIQVGRPLLIVNGDEITHNVNMTSKRNGKFNFAQRTEEHTRVFDVAETGIPIRCDLHSWMSSVAHVFKHPYFAVSGLDGSFTLANVPPGTYTLEAIHELYPAQTLQVEVTAKGTAEVSFTFQER
jgi:hypothetical protein